MHNISSVSKYLKIADGVQQLERSKHMNENPC